MVDFMVTVGTYTTGKLTPLPENAVIEYGKVYETYQLYDRIIPPSEEEHIRLETVKKLTSMGAKVLWISVKGRIVRTQFVFEKASLVEPLTVVTILGALALILAIVLALRPIFEAVYHVAKEAPVTFPLLAIAIILIAGAYIFTKIKAPIPPPVEKKAELRAV
ncbi:MAG: hypothetical protein ACTSX6_00145 [Candidatus Heimdallarchaeaceae archaeon]